MYMQINDFSLYASQLIEIPASNNAEINSWEQVGNFSISDPEKTNSDRSESKRWTREEDRLLLIGLNFGMGWKEIEFYFHVRLGPSSKRNHKDLYLRYEKIWKAAYPIRKIQTIRGPIHIESYKKRGKWSIKFLI